MCPFVQPCQSFLFLFAPSITPSVIVTNFKTCAIHLKAGSQIHRKLRGSEQVFSPVVVAVVVVVVLSFRCFVVLLLLLLLLLLLFSLFLSLSYSVPQPRGRYPFLPFSPESSVHRLVGFAGPRDKFRKERRQLRVFALCLLTLSSFR